MHQHSHQLHQGRFPHFFLCVQQWISKTKLHTHSRFCAMQLTFKVKYRQFCPVRRCSKFNMFSSTFFDSTRIDATSESKIFVDIAQTSYIWQHTQYYTFMSGDVTLLLKIITYPVKRLPHAGPIHSPLNANLHIGRINANHWCLIGWLMGCDSWVKHFRWYCANFLHFTTHTILYVYEWGCDPSAKNNNVPCKKTYTLKFHSLSIECWFKYW